MEKLLRITESPNRKAQKFQKRVNDKVEDYCPIIPLIKVDIEVEFQAIVEEAFSATKRHLW